MFGLGPTELAVILVLALLVMGPKRIPELASNLGKAIRSFRRATKELRDQIDIDDEVRRPFEDLRSALRDEPPPLPNYHLMTPAVPATAAAAGAEPAAPIPPGYSGADGTAPSHGPPPAQEAAAEPAGPHHSASVFSETTEAKAEPAAEAGKETPAR